MISQRTGANGDAVLRGFRFQPAFAIVAFIVGAFAITTSEARANDCDTVQAALVAGAKLPFSAFVQTGRNESGHFIETGTRYYFETGGKWRTTNRSSQDLVKDTIAQAKTQKRTCRSLGSEKIDGEDASVYIMHTERRGVTADNTFWISKSRGLPLKLVNTFNPKAATTIRYAYDRVTAPSGVK